MRRKKKFLIWILVGAVVFFVESFFICVNSYYEFVADPVLMLALTAVLYWAVNHYKEDRRFYFTKIVVCMLIGRFIDCIISYYLEKEEKYYTLRFTIAIAIFMTALLLCMRIIQMVYDRIENKKAYFGYVLLGTVLAVNAAYISESIDHISWKFDVYSLEHGIVLLMASASVIWQYQKHFKQIEKNGITVKTYLCNAVKMTLLSFLLFVFLMHELFLGF